MKTKNAIILFLTAFIWGTAFVAQSVGMDYLEPFTFNGIRSFIGAIALLPCIAILNKVNPTAKDAVGTKKDLLIGGVCCGVLLFAASSLQQVGIQYTSAGKAGFITAMYILIVPVIGLFMKKKVKANVWIGLAIAVVGLFLLCVNPEKGIKLQEGDVFVILCAVVFAFHIVVVDFYAPKVDGVKLSCVQFIVAGGISCVCMFLFEEPRVNEILDNTIPVLYAGIGSSGIAYTLQIVGQKYSPPTLASLAMSFESVFAVISQIVVTFVVYLAGKGELVLPTGREILGCVIMFAAIMLAQFEFPIKRKVTE